MYLVDTNVLSEARRGGREARDWFRSVNPNEVYLSALTLGEVAKGVALKRRNDPAAAATLQLWLDRLSVDHAKRVLPVTEDIALEWERLAAIRPRNTIDGLIAATAFVHRMTVVTRNVVNFGDLDLRIVDPWSAP
jgi:predicted nucleic acid-binding protein